MMKSGKKKQIIRQKPVGRKHPGRKHPGRRKVNQKRTLYAFLLLLAISVSIYLEKSFENPSAGGQQSASVSEGAELSPVRENALRNGWYEELPAYTGEASVPVHNNVPFFTAGEITTEVFEEYGSLDELGRCGTAFANVCREIMPTEEREGIGNVRPTGWHTVKYDVIADQYLYNRCHLIGYQLAGENANEKNLITGTRYMNVEGMLPWEDMVADYVEKTDNHVLYRVTPYFEGNNLVASGVLMEAYSVEDNGAGVCFNRYCYNVQPGILIDYGTGESRPDESWNPEKDRNQTQDYVLNTNTGKFHLPSCESVDDMDENNRKYFTGGRRELIEKGYAPCSRCKP